MPVRADPPELSRLQRPEHLHLSRGTHLPDLVEKERPVVGRLEEAVLETVGSREGPALVAEELALEERVLEGAAVYDRQGGLRPGAVSVERPGDQLLSGSALSLDEDRGVGGRRLVDEPEDPFDAGALPHDLRERVVRLERRFEVLGLTMPQRLLVRGAQNLTEVLEVERLVDEVEGAVASGIGGRLHRTLAAGDHNLRRRRHRAECSEGLRAGHAGLVEGEDDDGDLAAGHLVDRLFSALCRADAVAERGEHPGQEGPDTRFGVGDEHGPLLHRGEKRQGNFPVTRVYSSPIPGAGVKVFRRYADPIPRVHGGLPPSPRGTSGPAASGTGVASPRVRAGSHPPCPADCGSWKAEMEEHGHARPVETHPGPLYVVGGSHLGPSSRRSRRPVLGCSLATELTPADALATTATSSGTRRAGAPLTARAVLAGTAR